MVTQLNNTKSLAYATGEMKAVDFRPKPEALVVSVITDTGRATFTIALRAKLTLGRGDNQSPVDVDLTSFGALEKGVSRKHVMLMQHGTRVYMLDLGSTNGSQINGKALRTGSIYELKDKDEIALGRLKLSVTFAYESVTETALPTSLLVDKYVEPASQGLITLVTNAADDQSAAPVVQSVPDQPSTPTSNAADVQSIQQSAAVAQGMLEQPGTPTSNAADVQVAQQASASLLERLGILSGNSQDSGPETNIQDAQPASAGLLKRLGTLPGNSQDISPETIPDIHDNSSETLL